MSLALAPRLTPSFTVLDCPQRSPDWFAARLGRLTGSRAADMLTTTQKGGESAKRRDLRLQLALERLTRTVQEDRYVSPEMRRAVALEPQACAAYEAHSGVLTTRTGFLTHDTLPVGCSLDGHVGAFAGIVELKVPKSTTHLEYLRAGTVPPAYLPQIVHNLWVSGAAWCDFCSFDDRFPPALQTYVVRYDRDEQEIATYALVVAQFLSEVADEVEAVRAMTAA